MSNDNNTPKKENEENDESGMQRRAYGKSELAELYFPDKKPDDARRILMGWIKNNRKLWEALAESGLRPKAKLLNIYQVDLITEVLGKP